MTARDRWLLCTLLPLALVALGLHVREIVRSGLAEPVFYVSAPDPPGEHPRISGFRRDLVALPSELRVGDRLLRLGRVDVAGRGHFGIDAVALAEASPEGGLDLVYDRDGAVHETHVELGRASVPWARLPPMIAMLAVCVFVLVRSRAGAPARLLFVAFVSAVIFQSQFHGPQPWQTYTSKALFYALGAVVPPLTVLWALHFPPEAPRPSRMVAALPWLLVPAFAIPRASYLLGGPVPPARVPDAINGAHLAFALAFLAAATWNYWRSPPVGRRRMKWVLWSVWIGLLPLVLNVSFMLTLAGGDWYAKSADWTKLPMIALAVGLLLAMQRQSLFDVDRVLGVTATYTLLLAAAGIGIVALVPPSAAAASELLGVAPTSAQLGLSAAMAVAMLPLQSVVRPRIDRALFPERFQAQSTVTALLSDLSLGRDADDESVLEHSADEVARGFGARSAAVYARRGGSWERVWSSGSALGPERFEAGDPLLAVIGAQPAPIAAGGRRRRDLEALAPLQRAALDTLGAQLVAPLRNPDGLVGFLCLGARRSGDIYTATDAMLLGSVATQLALQLEHAKGRSLSRYVPEAVRASIEGRGGLSAGEREVSVLFVDLRGYSTRAAQSESRDVFDVLSRYTTRVSEIVRQCGGQVVEFHGDGLMAVFGAPEPLPAKERSAVLAAREIVAAVRALDPGALGAERAALDVGVGIATGPAFVGNIRAIDRWIWSAIGSTTNLAARLQAATREFDCSIAIDETTRARAGDEAAGFAARPDTPIRGLPAPITVHVAGAA